MKKLIFIFTIGVLGTVLIYNYTVNKKIDVLIIGDSVATGDTIYGNSGISYNLFFKQYMADKKLGNYDVTYTNNNMTTRDFNYQFTENNEINDKHLQNRIKDAEIIIISLGQDELVGNSKINNLRNLERKEFYENYNKMLSNIRLISNESIYVIGFYGDIINQLNEIESKLINISKNFDSKYLKISNIISDEDYFDDTKIHLNYEGHKKIFELLKSNIEINPPK